MHSRPIRTPIFHYNYTIRVKHVEILNEIHSRDYFLQKGISKSTADMSPQKQWGTHSALANLLLARILGP